VFEDSKKEEPDDDVEVKEEFLDETREEVHELQDYESEESEDEDFDPEE
jgi:hypothetical protein